MDKLVDILLNLETIDNSVFAEAAADLLNV